MRQAKHAFDRAHGAADTGANGPAYDPADRARDAVAFIGAFLRAAHDALGVSDVGNGEQRQCGGSRCERRAKLPIYRQHPAFNFDFLHLHSSEAVFILAGRLIGRRVAISNADAAKWLRLSGELTGSA
jgi:hypothetical protein